MSRWLIILWTCLFDHGLVLDHLRAVILPLQPEGHIDQPIITGTSTSGPITAAKACAGVDAKHRHCHGNRQLEVVAGSGEGQGGGLAIIGADGAGP